ncbi:MAG: polysaccharide pyruvyl transferase family protein [Sphaerospermopsis kisseleviana]
MTFQHNNWPISRRLFLQSTLVASIAASVRAAEKRSPRILLRSSWQVINIGDIGHTPGVLALLEKHLPEAEVQLSGNVSNGVGTMLEKRFPKLVILKDAKALKPAFAECDFLLHGSGPWLVSPNTIELWTKETGKPYGVYGISLPPDMAAKREIDLLSKARFVFFRDGVSLQVAKDKGVTCPVMEFGPDGTFGVDLRNDAKATAYLAQNDLKDGQFLCCIPRFRHPPDWLIPEKKMAIDQAKHDLNQKWKEHDHAPLREAIIQVVRETPMKVLICPEDVTQMAIGKEMIFDKLPDDVKPKVVWRPDFWLTDEALSVYVRSAGLFGNEMHSPIMCIGNGIPAIVCRWDTQTSKGIMWRDIGLGEWLFDFDIEAEVKAMPAAVLAMAKDPAAAKAKAAKGREFVQQRQRETMAVLKKELPI